MPADHQHYYDWEQDLNNLKENITSSKSADRVIQQKFNRGISSIFAPNIEIK